VSQSTVWKPKAHTKETITVISAVCPTHQTLNSREAQKKRGKRYNEHLNFTARKHRPMGIK
jgi:hypothetical protein